MMGVLWYVVKEDIPRKILTKHHFSSDIEGIETIKNLTQNLVMKIYKIFYLQHK